jgi:hypothetical protein
MKLCRNKLHEYSEKLSACPHCAKIWRDAHPGWRREYYLKNKEIASLKYKEWYRKNIEREKFTAKIWEQNNKDKRAANCNKRIAALKQQTPKWLSKEQIKEMDQFYNDARDLQWLNSPLDKLTVDHIVPLQSKIVSGLHVPWNLQIIQKSLNCSKGISV